MFDILCSLPWNRLFYVFYPLNHLGLPHNVDILDEGIILLPERHPDGLILALFCKNLNSIRWGLHSLALCVVKWSALCCVEHKKDLPFLTGIATGWLGYVLQKAKNGSNWHSDILMRELTDNLKDCFLPQGRCSVYRKPKAEQLMSFWLAQKSNPFSDEISTSYLEKEKKNCWHVSWTLWLMFWTKISNLLVRVE